MKIGAYIPYCKKLSEYIFKVCQQFNTCDRLLIEECDFNKKPESEYRNEALEKMEDCDLVWMIDADEFILREHQLEIIDNLKREKKDIGLCPVIDYTTDYDFKYKDRGHNAIVIVNPKKVRFYDERCVHLDNANTFSDYPLHHFGFAFQSAEIMKWKKDNYWSKSNINEHSELLKRAIERSNIPEEIETLLREV